MHLFKWWVLSNSFRNLLTIYKLVFFKMAKCTAIKNSHATQIGQETQMSGIRPNKNGMIMESVPIDSNNTLKFHFATNRGKAIPYPPRQLENAFLSQNACSRRSEVTKIYFRTCTSSQSSEDSSKFANSDSVGEFRVDTGRENKGTCLIIGRDFGHIDISDQEIAIPRDGEVTIISNQSNNEDVTNHSDFSDEETIIHERRHQTIGNLSEFPSKGETIQMINSLLLTSRILYTISTNDANEFLTKSLRHMESCKSRNVPKGDKLAVAYIPEGYSKAGGFLSTMESCCIVCSSVFRAGDVISILPHCGHGCHKTCALEFLLTCNKCPTCSATFLHFGNLTHQSK